MKQYHDLVQDVLLNGVGKDDRTGTGTRSVFGRQVRLDLAEGFPLLTTKKIHLKSVLHELLWFISGDTNIGYLQKHGVTIWDEWADDAGNLGPVYGAQWRAWHLVGTGWVEPVDQLQAAINTLRTKPDDRRIIVSAWNVTDIPYMALPPCHLLFQFYSRPATMLEVRASLAKQNTPHHANGEFRILDCQVYQRSADVGLGVPFNWASYAALIHMVAKITGHIPGELIWTGGDVHVYKNHVEGLSEQLTREHRRLPQLVIHGDQREIDDFKYEDFELLGYDPHPAIKLAVAV